MTHVLLVQSTGEKSKSHESGWTFPEGSYKYLGELTHALATRVGWSEVGLRVYNDSIKTV